MTDSPLRLKTALAGRYRPESTLGHGGMATVYEAHDERHDRQVALKVLRPELAAILGPERFLREIRVTAGLQHPHILPLLDSGEADGFLFYVMPRVTGGSLRDRLARSGPLELEHAIRLVEAVAAALDYAHRVGVVHRDIKPENILLHGGEAMIADFGIAVAVSSAAGDRLTETGITVGTPGYMSPEQASGERDLDGRTDVYSLACVFYELLAGEPPYTGPSAQAILAKSLTEPIPHLATVRSVPGHVEQAVARALAKNRADRFGTAGAFAAALRDASAIPARAPARRPARVRRVVVGALAIGVASALVWFATGSAGRATPRRVAVLYFDNLSPDSSNAYLADGITEEIIGRLGDVPRLAVQSRAAVKRFRGTAGTDPVAVGRALGVTHLVSGSVRRSGSHVRVTVELVNIASGARLWGTTVDRPDGDLLAIEDDIAQAVAGGVIGGLAPGERALLTARATRNPEAYDHYLRGNFYLNRRASEADGRRALDEYQAALRVDPGFAGAYGRLGLVYGIYANWPWPYPGLNTDSLLGRGLAAANQALALDSESVDGWLARGFLLIPHPGDDETWRAFALDPSLLVGTVHLACPAGMPHCARAAVKVLARAVTLAPRDAEVWYQYGRALHVVVMLPGGPFDAADSALRHSLALDPDRAVSAWLLGLSYVRQRRWDDAVRMLDSAIALRRHDPSVLTLRVQARLERGDVAGARVDLDTLKRVLSTRLPADSVASVYEAALRVVVDARRGDSLAARTRLAEMHRRHPVATVRSQTMLIALAAADIAVGNHDRGLALLERVTPLGPGTLNHPLWDAVRTEPRFRRLVERVRLASRSEDP